VKTYSYDAKDKLIGVSATESDVEVSSSAYSYNVNGIRDSKTEDGVTTSYVVDSNRDYAQVLEEIVDGTSTVTYSYGHDLLSQSRSDEFKFYLYDGLGSTRGLSNSEGVLTDTYDYEAFGEVLNETGSTDNNYKFTGEQFDASLDQYYLRARYYDQGVGRFTQQDEWDGKLCTPITLNKYIYGYSDPAKFTDPSGYSGFNISGLMAGLRIGARMSSSAGGSVARFSVGSKGRGGIAKGIGCKIGVAYLKKQYRGDGNHGHHTIPKNLGGNPDQALLFVPAETHRMFHFVLDVVLRNTPELEGKGNWTSKKDWSSISRTINGRKQLYSAILKSSRIVDKYCKLKGPASLTAFVRKGRNDFIGVVK
jgi:RHS repeat-associated protein